MQLGRGLREEIIYTIANLLNAEEHLVESFIVDRDMTFLELADEIRKQRQDLVKALIKKGRESLWRKHWCTLKHLMITYIHLEEDLLFMKRSNVSHEIIEKFANCMKSIKGMINFYIDYLNGEISMK